MTDEVMTEATEVDLPVPDPRVTAFRAGAPVSAIVPRTLGELAMVAAAIIKAGMAPDSYIVEPGGPVSEETKHEAAEKTKSRIMVGIMKGAEVGLPPITALSTIAIISNRPCVWGDGAMALVQSRGAIERIEECFEGEERTGGPVADETVDMDYSPTLRDFTDDFAAVCRIWRRGQTEPYIGRFSVRDAKRAHLWGNPKKQPWIQYPKRMLKIRARVYPLRDGFADCLMGLAIREEVDDLHVVPPKTDTSFLDDAPATTEPPAVVPAPTEQPMEIMVGLPTAEALTQADVEAQRRALFGVPIPVALDPELATPQTGKELRVLIGRRDQRRLEPLPRSKTGEPRRQPRPSRSSNRGARPNPIGGTPAKS
jgi:hypothetical protein